MSRRVTAQQIEPFTTPAPGTVWRSIEEPDRWYRVLRVSQVAIVNWHVRRVRGTEKRPQIIVWDYHRGIEWDAPERCFGGRWQTWEQMPPDALPRELQA